jgi:hypothetical protein
MRDQWRAGRDSDGLVVPRPGEHLPRLPLRPDGRFRSTSTSGCTEPHAEQLREVPHRLEIPSRGSATLLAGRPARLHLPAARPSGARPRRAGWRRRHHRAGNRLRGSFAATSAAAPDEPLPALEEPPRSPRPGVADRDPEEGRHEPHEAGAHEPASHSGARGGAGRGSVLMSFGTQLD